MKRTKMNQTIFKQLDPKWSNLAYPTKSSTFGATGCGCCACTHIAIEQSSKASWNPKKLRKWMVQQGFAVAGQGTTWSGITETLRYIGHKSVVRIWDDPMSEAWKELNKGNRIGVILFNNGYAPNGTHWTASGHYVAFTNYKVKNDLHYFYCKDSGCRDHDGWYTYEKSMKGCIAKMWIVEKIVEKTNGQKLAEKGWEFAYHSSKDKNAKYPSGKPKPAYAKALDKYFGKNRKWSTPAKKGASCDVFVATCIRAAGLGDAPRGIVRSWLNASKNFKQVKVTPETAKNGDIVSIVWKNGNPHWCMVYNGKILEASYGGWYPKVTNTLKSRLSKSGKQSVVVYRAK